MLQTEHDVVEFAALFELQHPDFKETMTKTPAFRRDLGSSALLNVGSLVGVSVRFQVWGRSRQIPTPCMEDLLISRL